MSLLTVTNLSVRFDELAILEDVSFSLEKGESLAIVGPNGSGKTVLLKSILGLLPYEGAAEWQAGTRTGYVPQKIQADRHLPITLENLLDAKARVLQASKEHEIEAVKEIGLTTETLRTPVGHLSGGQFQKGLLALALLGNPQVILLDEPTASLDQPSEEHIYELIHRLQDAHGFSIVIVSHDLNMVYRYADKVLCLNKQNICFGVPEEVLNEETIKKLFGSSYKYFHHPHSGERHQHNS